MFIEWETGFPFYKDHSERLIRHNAKLSLAKRTRTPKHIWLQSLHIFYHYIMSISYLKYLVPSNCLQMSVGLGISDVFVCGLVCFCLFQKGCIPNIWLIQKTISSQTWDCSSRQYLNPDIVHPDNMWTSSVHLYIEVPDHMWVNVKGKIEVKGKEE